MPFSLPISHSPLSTPYLRRAGLGQHAVASVVLFSGADLSRLASVVASAAAAAARAGDTVDALLLHTCDVTSLRRSGAAICLLMRIRDIYTRAGSAARERRADISTGAAARAARHERGRLPADGRICI